MRSRLLFAFTLSVSLGLGTVWTQEMDSASRIRRVENGLLPPVLVKGEKGWTLAERMEAYHVPGVSVAVFKDNTIVWAKGYGVKDVETNEPVDVSTLFVAGSVSKPVAAMGAESQRAGEAQAAAPPQPPKPEKKPEPAKNAPAAPQSTAEMTEDEETAVTNARLTKKAFPKVYKETLKELGMIDDGKDLPPAAAAMVVDKINRYLDALEAQASR